jgi:phosphoribosylformylglycinamidine synthase
MKRVRILIRPKKGLLDPQGRAVREMLLDQGFKVGEVTVGKVVELELEEGQEVRDLVEKYIVNPLIEDYEIEDLR